MTMLRRPPTRHNAERSSRHDVTLVPLAISLVAFAISCAVLFVLAMAKPGELWHVAIAIVVIAALVGASWHLHRLHRRELRRDGVCRPAPPPSDAPPPTVLRFSELRTTACRREPSEGRAFTVRCFRLDCTAPLVCPNEAAEQPAPRQA